MDNGRTLSLPPSLEYMFCLLQLALEQHLFELSRFAYTQIFFQYSQPFISGGFEYTGSSTAWELVPLTPMWFEGQLYSHTSSHFKDKAMNEYVLKLSELCT